MLDSFVLKLNPTPNHGLVPLTKILAILLSRYLVYVAWGVLNFDLVGNVLLENLKLTHGHDYTNFPSSPINIPKPQILGKIVVRFSKYYENL
jgi:hypothetical protein